MEMIPDDERARRRREALFKLVDWLAERIVDDLVKEEAAKAAAREDQPQAATQGQSSDLRPAGLARLRASKERSASQARELGHVIGNAWALDRAEYGELERVASLLNSGQPLGDLAPLAQAVRPDAPAAITAKNILGTETPSAELVRGFIEGAAEVFRQV